MWQALTILFDKGIDRAIPWLGKGVMVSSDLKFEGVPNFFRKFAEIFAAQGAPPVSLTPAANGKIFNHKSFNYFVELTYR